MVFNFQIHEKSFFNVLTNFRIYRKTFEEGQYLYFSNFTTPRKNISKIQDCESRSPALEAQIHSDFLLQNRDRLNNAKI